MKIQHSFLSALVVAASSCLLFVKCTKPTEGLVINVQSGIMPYTVALQFTDGTAQNAIPKDLTVQVTGEDAENIYDYSGSKAVHINSGVVTLGVHPEHDPSTGNEIHFNVLASATGYLPVNIPVTILDGQKNSNLVVPMVNLAKTPDGVVATTKTAALANNAVAAPIVVNTAANASTTTKTSVTVPTGTQFKDANNKVITGANVGVTVVTFDPTQPGAMFTLPEGCSQSNIAGLPEGQSSVFFVPAGFATINMLVNGTSVRNFSQPIDVAISVNPTLINAQTNALAKAGDVVSLYSYEVETGIWSYEKEVTLTNVNGTLTGAFQTSHLTTFLLSFKSDKKPCKKTSTLKFTSTGIKDNSSDQFILDITPIGAGISAMPIVSNYLTLHNNDQVNLAGLPDGDLKIQLYKVDYDHYLLNDYKNRGTKVAETTVNLCSSGKTNVNVTFTPGTYFTGTGVAICPNDITRRFTPPNGAEVDYRKAGTSDAFRILGRFVNGQITSSGVTSGQRYDLQGNFAGKLIGRTNILITPGINILDTTHIINSGSSFCP